MDSIITVATVPAVLAIVNLLKGVGLSGKWSALVSVLVAGVLVMGEAYIHEELWQNISKLIILGLSASGLYDVTYGSRAKEHEEILSEAVGEKVIIPESAPVIVSDDAPVIAPSAVADSPQQLASHSERESN